MAPSWEAAHSIMRASIVLAIVILSGSLRAQTFPTLNGELANGTAVQLPGDPKTPRIVIALAYGQKAQADLEAWYEPAYLRFVAKHGLFANAYSTELYFVPLFTGANKAAYEPSMKRFRKSATPETADRVVFVRTELEAVREALGLKDKDIPYFFVVDRDGRIVHREQGAFTEDKLDAIEEALMP